MDLLHPYLFIIMEQTSPKKRIEYIDLMKGVCITLVVLYHVYEHFDSEVIDKALNNFRMPLYFFLSGLFFKKYSGFTDFVVRKTNKLIIPYLFFSIIPYCVLAPLFTDDYKDPMFVLMSILRPYNQPLWFLRALFVMYILYYGFKNLTDKYPRKTQLLLLAIITFINYIASLFVCNIHYPDEFGTLFNFITNTILAPIMALPFMYAAEWVRMTNLLNRKMTVTQQIVSFVISVSVLIIFAQKSVNFESASFSRFYPFVYVSAFGGIYALAILCQRINKLFFFSYLGRYSIIVLGTHWVYLIAIRGIIEISHLYEFLIIILLMPPTIWLFKKLFPYFTAQKDLLHWNK